jgi:hypothetical protein
MLKVGVGHGFQLSRVQKVSGLGKTLSPATNALPINPELHALLGRDVAVIGCDDDPGALDDPVLRRRRPDQMLKHPTLTRQKDNRR